ncbi:MAG: LPS-assembly protein LptD [Phycisphaerales bacterium]|nr:MAG: LPS-assembly protein LptD [Phycisphaerales bacterium]
MALAAGSLAACPGLAIAQPAADGGVQPSPEASIEPLAITGRGFAGIVLPVGVTDGPLSFSGRRAWTWTEQAPSPGEPGAGGAEVRRLLISGEVAVTIGVRRFEAQRAAVWLQRVPEEETDGREVWQTWVYFDRLENATSAASTGLAGPRVPVQAIVRPASGVALRADVVERGRPTDQLLTEGERELAAYLRALVGGPAWAARYEAMVARREGETDDGPIAPPSVFDRPAPTRAIDPDLAAVADLLERLPRGSVSEPIFSPDGSLSVAAGDLAFVPGEDENALIVTGGVVMQAWEPGARRTLQLDAERAVVFLEPGPIERFGRFEIADVRGIYLEGGVVATDGEYTLRGPRVFYDVRADRAIVLDAVFWTYNARVRMPLYVRADAVRQESASQFKAERATLANTGFARPHFSVGAGSVTIEREERAGLEDRTIADARHLTLRAGPVPFFYFPRFRGDPENIPLRDVSFESSSGSGEGVRTTWNLFGLTGIDGPDGLSADLLLDFYSQRGPAIGTEFRWSTPEQQGELFGYLVIDDRGTDVLSTGAEIENDSEVRGLATLAHRWRLNDEWTFLVEGSYISDETFVEALFQGDARSRREFANRMLAQRTEANQAFTMELKGTFNDFTPNQAILQSRGYTVDRLPEARHQVIAQDVFSASAPGLISYSSDTRLGVVRLSFTEPTARQFGFTGLRQSQAAFGVEPDESLGDRLRSEGYTESEVVRFDTRQEVTAQLASGPWRLTPFAIGRVTAWDNDFSEFSPEEDDQIRVWGGVGMRASTELQRVYNGVQSDLFDLNRARHIVEPSVTVMTSGTTIDRKDLPVYDEDVENIFAGSMVRFGLNQTWQTKRGGPGRWRDVDVLVFDNELVFTTDDDGLTSPVGRYIESRPELTNPGEYWTAEAGWQVTDAVALSGQNVFDLDLGQNARTSVGVLVRHTPRFQTLTELRYLNAQDSTYLDLAAFYELTAKYRLNGSMSYDTDDRDVQRVGGELQREFPNAILGAGINYNNITGETSFGFSFSPMGTQRQGVRVRGLGAADGRNRGSRLGG